MNTTYDLPTYGTLLSHYPLRPPIARDIESRRGSPRRSYGDDIDSDETTEFLIQARVRSGDYFATLATELDKLAQSLSLSQAPEAPSLERMVPELLYLDKHYSIRRKQP